VTVNAPGYIYDESQLATLTILPKMLNQMPVYVQRTSSIVVTSLTASNTPIPGAQITASSPKFGTRVLSTDAQGKATFIDSYVGTYTVSMYASGYVTPPSQIATVTSGGMVGASAVAVNFIAATSGGLNVTVLDDVTSSTVSGAVVTVTGPSPSTNNAPGSPGTTGGSGLVALNSLVAGSYNVVVTRTGTPGTGPCYVSETNVATVNWSATTAMTVRLTPWGSLNIRPMKGTTPQKNYTLKITGPGGYSNSSLKTNATTGILVVPYLQAGTYTIRPASKTTPSFTYVVSDGVIPTTATDLVSTSW